MSSSSTRTTGVVYLKMSDDQQMNPVTALTPDINDIDMLVLGGVVYLKMNDGYGITNGMHGPYFKVHVNNPQPQKIVRFVYEVGKLLRYQGFQCAQTALVTFTVSNYPDGELQFTYRNNNLSLYQPYTVNFKNDFIFYYCQTA